MFIEIAIFCSIGSSSSVYCSKKSEMFVDVSNEIILLIKNYTELDHPRLKSWLCHCAEGIKESIKSL